MQIKPRILCPITDWYEKEISHGPKAGTKVRERKRLGLNKWNFFVSTEREGGETMKQESFFGSLRSFMTCLHHMTDDPKWAVDRIIKALVKQTGKNPVIHL